MEVSFTLLQRKWGHEQLGFFIRIAEKILCLWGTSFANSC